jgi:hypothetical protein
VDRESKKAVKVLAAIAESNTRFLHFANTLRSRADVVHVAHDLNAGKPRTILSLERNQPIFSIGMLRFGLKFRLKKKGSFLNAKILIKQVGTRNRISAVWEMS